MLTIGYDYPISISNPGTEIANLSVRATLHIGGIHGKVCAGESWAASDGRRLIWAAHGGGVYYSIKGQFFFQSAKGFIGEIITYAHYEGARRAAPMARLAVLEMNLLMGVLAGSSGVGFAIVVGTDVLRFTLENRGDFQTWEQQLQAALEVRAYLKQHAPTLYDKVFDAVLKQVWKDVKGKIPDAVTADTVTFAVGVVIGSVGKAAAKGKFSILGVLLVILQQIVMRFGLNVAPEAINLTTAEYAKLAEELIRKLKEEGVAITDGDVRKIVAEVHKHPREIKEAFDKLQAEFAKDAKKEPSPR